jgi:hypothetical protein
MSGTPETLDVAANALHEAAREVEDATARAEIAEASIALADEHADAAMLVAAEVMENAMRTALGERLAAFEVEVRACLEDLRSRVDSPLPTPEVPLLKDVDARLRVIEVMIAELEAEEAEEAAEAKKPEALTPPKSEASIAPQSLPKTGKNAGAENPVKKRAKVRNWI